jgi:hypothetical protein
MYYALKSIEEKSENETQTVQTVRGACLCEAFVGLSWQKWSRKNGAKVLNKRMSMRP